MGAAPALGVPAPIDEAFTETLHLTAASRLVMSTTRNLSSWSTRIEKIGAKNARRDREVPLVLPVCRQLVEHAFAWGLGTDGKLLRSWPMNWRDLQDVACYLEIEPFSLHSLRHTFAAWHPAEGVSWVDTARALGHADTSGVPEAFLNARSLRVSPPHPLRWGSTSRGPLLERGF